METTLAGGSGELVAKDSWSQGCAASVAIDVELEAAYEQAADTTPFVVYVHGPEKKHQK